MEQTQTVEQKAPEIQIRYRKSRSGLENGYVRATSSVTTETGMHYHVELPVLYNASNAEIEESKAAAAALLREKLSAIFNVEAA